MAKNVNFGSDTHISGAKMNPFNTFGLNVFTYLKHIGVQINEKITGKTASGFLLFLEKYRVKKPVNEPSPLLKLSQITRRQPFWELTNGH